MVNSLRDSHGRQIKSVRISITDRCNLRCKYCMPEDGIIWQERSKILTFEEILRLVKLFSEYNVTNVRLTGGEPSVRENYIDLIKMIKEHVPNISLSMTTNGLNLERDAEALKNSGLDRLNISLDTLDQEKFHQITRRNNLGNVIKGIEKAVALGFETIKINAVSIKDFNTEKKELENFLNFASKYKIEVRFIEFMPFTGMGWNRGSFITSKELRDTIGNIQELEKLPLEDPSQTSRIWQIKGKPGKIGFISSVSESFCDSCDRIRVTSEGNIRPCLHNNKEYPIRDLMRSGATNEELIQAIKTGLLEKWKEHPDFLALTYLPPLNDREMIRIGG